MKDRDFKVIRAHGTYAVGDTRTGDPLLLDHLIGKCLAPLGENDGIAVVGGGEKAKGGAKKAPAVSNKAAPDDLLNKGD